LPQSQGKPDPGDTMLVILTGEVRISLPGTEGRDQVLRILKSGDVLGEIALWVIAPVSQS
jgi:CRP/FNR family transcriptional regulator, cyclic AMP receptor protein